jgi:hypothetical protein
LLAGVNNDRYFKIQVGLIIAAGVITVIMWLTGIAMIGVIGTISALIAVALQRRDINKAKRQQFQKPRT